MRSRITPLRNRRDVGVKYVQNAVRSRNERDASDSSKTNKDVVILPTSLSTTSVDLTSKSNDSDADNQRLKRETPECVINYNSPRQLFVGCSQSNVIEVKPHCSDDGEEGK